VGVRDRAPRRRGDSQAAAALSGAGPSWEDQEVLLGHRMAYCKPTLEHMEQEYLKAAPFLTLSEAEQAKRELSKE
jgi:hypothetical protein